MVVLAQVGWLISRDMGFSLGSDHFSDAIANCVWALYTLYLYKSNDLESGRKKRKYTILQVQNCNQLFTRH
jgi:hypothetical protein